MLCTVNFVVKLIIGRTIISNKQNFETKLFGWVFMHLKIKIKKIQTQNKTHQDKNLEINFIQVMQNLSASKCCSNF